MKIEETEAARDTMRMDVLKEEEKD